VGNIKSITDSIQGMLDDNKIKLDFNKIRLDNNLIMTGGIKSMLDNIHITLAKTKSILKVEFDRKYPNTRVHPGGCGYIFFRPK